ncbi:hypothetical protein GCM10010321_25240 [Streptomyces chartreusis]|nr:hypothetical protein GCM10010321_25240 [Streptomyces chartreusis]
MDDRAQELARLAHLRERHLGTDHPGRQALHPRQLQHLVNKKAKELAVLLAQNGKRVWVGEAVCFTDGALRVRLPAHDQNGVYAVRQPSGYAVGPALIFDYHPDTLKLDEYLIQYGEKLDFHGRMAPVRQLAENTRSTHSSRIHHRALAARSVLVVPRPRGRKGPGRGGGSRLAHPAPPDLRCYDCRPVSIRSRSVS